MDAVAEHAGFLAAHGILCVSDGGPLIPLVAFEQPGGERKMIRLVMERLEAGVEAGRRWLADNAEGATHAVLVFDGFISIDESR